MVDFRTCIVYAKAKFKSDNGGPIAVIREDTCGDGSTLNL